MPWKKLDPAHFLTGPRLGWQAALKVELLTDIDMSLMEEKDIRGGICHSNTWKILIKIKK